MSIGSIAAIRGARGSNKPRAKSAGATVGTAGNAITQQLQAERDLLGTPYGQQRRAEVIEENRRLEPVEGMLKKAARRGPFGLLGEVLHKRWFKLVPEFANLSYWVPGCTCPKRTLKLQDLQELDMNRHYHKIFLKFKGMRFMRLEAESADEFSRWMAVFACYAKPTMLKLHDILDLSIKAREQKKHGKPASLKADTAPSFGLCIDDPPLPIDDTKMNLHEANLQGVEGSKKFEDRSYHVPDDATMGRMMRRQAYLDSLPDVDL